MLTTKIKRKPKRMPISALCLGLCACALTAFSPIHARAMSLEEAVKSAISTNPTARATDQAMRAAAMDLLELEREFLPRVSAYAETGQARFDDPDRLGPDEQGEISGYNETGLIVEYTLFDGYRRANSVYRNAARLDGAILRVLDASETMALSVVEAYIDVLRHRDLLRFAQDSVRRHEDLERQVRDQVASGRLATSAAFEAEDRLIAARLSTIQVRQALRDAETAFTAVVGTAPAAAMSLPALPQMTLDREDFIISSVRGSFRLAVEDRAVAERRFETGVVASDVLPQVTLEGGVRRAEDVSGTDGVDEDAFLGLRVDWQLYAGGRDARARALSHRSLEAEARRDAARRDVIALAERSWTNSMAAFERAFLLQNQKTAAERTAQEYVSEFEAGSRSLLEVMDAERARFNVTFEAISAEASHVFAQYRLLAAQSRLADHFGIARADLALAPDFVERAEQASKLRGIFNTEIRALE